MSHFVGPSLAMAAEGVPVVHLLYLQGLALRHGLPWDPAGFPEVGSTPLLSGQGDVSLSFWLVTGVYLLSLSLLFFPPLTRPPR